jgi:hypothetical protein
MVKEWRGPLGGVALFQECLGVLLLLVLSLLRDRLVLVLLVLCPLHLDPHSLLLVF